jgi:hypothetical protein
MKTFVIMRRSGWANPGELEVAAGRSSRVGLEEMADRVKWIRSYVLDEGQGAVGTVCIYQGTDAEAVREHARRAGLPADEVIELVDTVIINEDPARAA